MLSCCRTGCCEVHKATERRPAQALNINAEKMDIDGFCYEDFELVGYQPHRKIAMDLAV